MSDYDIYYKGLPNYVMNGAGPLLIGIWLANVAYNTPTLLRRRYALASIASLLISVILAEIGKRCVIWPHDPTFPSGHETFASSVAASVCARDCRWLPLCIAACIVLGWAMVMLHAHTPFELTAGTLLGSATTACIMRFTAKIPSTVAAQSPAE